MACKECGKDKKIVARGWCRNCYARWYNKGTASYAPKPEKVVCSVGGCNALAVAKGMCDKHYRRVKQHGDAEHGSSVDWGARSKHPLYHSWKWMRRHKSSTPVCQKWLDDFWQYVFDAGERPSNKHKMFRANDAEPLGPDNFVWKESFVQKVVGEDDKTYFARAQRAYRYADPDRYGDYALKHNYGLSNSELEEMLEVQEHKCAICGENESLEIRGKIVRLAVDHCHETGKVRGMLCTRCNQGLGYFRDRIDLLDAAKQYLQPDQIRQTTTDSVGGQHDKMGGAYGGPTEDRIDPFTCPVCGEPTDNGHDREYPPNPYVCSKCC